MRLTKKKAIEIAIELWTWLVKNSSDSIAGKWEWLGWDEYGLMESDCPLCEYSLRKAKSLAINICPFCPYYQKYGLCFMTGTPYDRWDRANNSNDAQEAAKDFLEELKQL